MNKIIIASLALFLFVPAQAFGLGYLESNHGLKLELGESGTIDFFLDNPTTGSTLQAEVTGPGAQYYKYDSEMIATDGQNKFTFTVTIPEDYDGAAKLKNAITVTQLADKDPSKQIALQSAVRVDSTITIDDDYKYNDRYDDKHYDDYDEYGYYDEHDYYEGSGELEQRIAELEEENEMLRQTIAELEEKISQLNQVLMEQVSFIYEWVLAQKT